MKRLAAVLALVLSSYVLAPALVAPANADDYVKGVRTSCNIAVPAVVRAQQAPRVTVTVRPNAPANAAARVAQPSGTVELAILRAGTPIFTKTVAYSGRPVTVTGPAIREPGRYVVRATFRTADGTVFRSCHNNDAFNVRSGSAPDDVGPGGPDAGNTNPGGLLPDTGGPDMFWLVLALTLVGSGGALVYASRRRPRAPLYDV